MKKYIKNSPVLDKIALMAAIAFFVFTILSIYILFNVHAERDKTVKNIVIVECKTDNQLADKVKDKIVELNIKHPDIVFAQAILESANFTSNIFLENNNMFGFKRVERRATTQTGKNKGYGVYNNWEECVIDYALFQTYSAKNLDRDSYFNFLSKNYASDKNYIQKLKKIIRQNEKN